MNHDLSPVSLASSTLCLGYETEGWNLSEVSDGSAGVPRAFSFRVIFETPFRSTPVVHVGLAGFDIDQRDSARLKVSAGEVDGRGFTLTVTAWHDTRVYEADVNWLAIGF